QHPRNYAAWQARETDFVPEQGESLQMFYTRVAAAVDALAARHRGQRIVLVAHGGVLDCVYRMATGLALHAPRDFDLKNASVNRLRWSGDGLRLVAWGEVGHLAAETLDEVDRRVP
ncbi:MAG: histidine phosphatase family protein, partial [Burkholderiales bacterium]|nr:histidine phosphatase family protein [Burkholderiales bacterium]